MSREVAPLRHQAGDARKDGDDFGRRFAQEQD